MIIRSDDEGIPLSEVKYFKNILVLSDGNGKYNQIEIKSETPTLSHYGGDVGDLNQDNIPDFVTMTGSLMKILWGQPNPPYFDESNSSSFANQYVAYINGNFYSYENNNGFGENCSECISNFVHNCKISDVNKDGINDLLLCNTENSVSSNTILINKGRGRFNKSSIIKLPFYTNDTTAKMTNMDYITDDLNGDGLTDIVAVNTNGYFGWDIVAYIQKPDGNFELNKNLFTFNLNLIKKGNWKSRLIYYDYDKDGKKDISYTDAEKIDINYKSIFLKTNNSFLEASLLNYDSYLKSLFK